MTEKIGVFVTAMNKEWNNDEVLDALERTFKYNGIPLRRDPEKIKDRKDELDEVIEIHVHRTGMTKAEYLGETAPAHVRLKEEDNDDAN